MAWHRRRRGADRNGLPPTYPLECGWCGETRTRPMDTTCPVCGGAWYRLSDRRAAAAHLPVSEPGAGEWH
jgi:hypothetical protein